MPPDVLLWRGWWRPARGRWLLIAEHPDEETCRAGLREAKPDGGDYYLSPPGGADPNTTRKR